MAKKRSETVCVKVTLPEELYIAIKGLAKSDMRTVSAEICMILTAALSGDEGEVPEEELPEAIGFKFEPQEEESEEEDPDEEEDTKKSRKKARPNRK